jgi:hypothetical protein
MRDVDDYDDGLDGRRSRPDVTTLVFRNGSGTHSVTLTPAPVAGP